MQAIVHFLTPFIDRVGPLNILILLWILMVTTIVLLTMWVLWEITTAFREWQDCREAEARGEAEALIGADATPSLMFPRGNANDGGISGMFFAICLNGGTANVVENSILHGLKCGYPCLEHPECQLAN